MVKSAVSLAVEVALIVVFFVALMILAARVAGAAEKAPDGASSLRRVSNGATSLTTRWVPLA
jgi:hypothetical protein